jgi:ribokinase
MITDNDYSLALGMRGEQMTGWRALESPDELVLMHALEKLRAREGLTSARLLAGATRVAAPLFNLAAVRRYADSHEVDPSQAVLAVVSECVRDALDGTNHIVADVVLALGISADAYRRHGIMPGVVEALYSDLLGRRRKTLIGSWSRLHETLEAVPAEVPSDRSLRGGLERLVLAELARQLVRRDIYSLGAKSAVGRTPSDAVQNRTSPGAKSRVIVVGGAVMDATFHTKSVPQPETSSEAYDFDLSPGGKGLTQAVAAARLGLDVSLIAAIADDRFGQEIIKHLQDEHVDTSMMKFVPDARTAFTGVIEFELGDSLAVNWRNDRELRLDLRDIDRIESQLCASDAILVTFELPRESVQRTLALAHRAQSHRPLIIVTPGQPYTNSGVSGQTLTQIDYLVAHAWELGRYAPMDQAKFDLDAVARRMLAYGVGTLCVPSGAGCTIYSETLGTFTVPTFPSQYKESSAARDAFCAALAAKLIEDGYEFSEEVALWATAAMAAAIADHPLPNSMPDRQRVDQLLNRSRFTVAPRIAAANPANGASGVEDSRGQPPSHP